MINHQLNSFTRLRSIGGLFIALLSLAAATETARAQSTDRDNPTPLAANEIRGSGVGKKVEYYYTFLAGPGEVVLTVDSGAKGSFSQLEAQLFDLDAEKLAQVQNLPYPGETARKVTRASFGAQQPVLLRVFLDRDAAQYLVRVAGAVQLAGIDAAFSSATPATTPVANGSTAPTPSDTPQPPPAPTDSVALQPVPSTPDPATAGEATANPTTGKMSGLKKLWLRLSQAGEILGLAGIGSLHVEMKDGTAQDVGLGKIKSVLVGEATQAPTDGSNITPSGEDKLTGWQRLWLKLGTAGELAGLSGRPFRLEMKDGTVQEFSPAMVKKISIKK